MQINKVNLLSTKYDIFFISKRMQITVTKKALLKALNNVQSVVDKRHTMQILANVKISAKSNKITLHTTDMDIAINDTFSGDVGGEILTTIPTHLFFEIIKKLQDDDEIKVMFDISNSLRKATIYSGTSKFTLPCLSVEGFPNFEIGENVCNFSMHSKELKFLLNCTKHAICLDETRYYLNGVYLHVLEEQGVIRAVATDVHRLAMAESDMPENAKKMPGVIIPKKTVYELTRLLEEFDDEVSIGVSQNKIRIQLADTILISKLIDASFPEYEKIIPKDNNVELKISTDELAKSIDLVTAVSFENPKIVKFHLMQNKVILSVDNKDNTNASGSRELAANINVDDMYIAFNAKYILDALANISGNNTIIKIPNNDHSATLLKDHTNNKCQFIIMPIQV